jgi:hypothetical protein
MAEDRDMRVRVEGFSKSSATTFPDSRGSPYPVFLNSAAALRMLRISVLDASSTWRKCLNPSTNMEKLCKNHYFKVSL